MFDIVYDNLEEWKISLNDILKLNEYTVLYFYPKDNTPWCSIQADEFSNDISKFNEKWIQIIWVSKDWIESHKKFIQNKSIKFPLISDINFDLHKIYWTYWEKSMFWKKYMWTIRSIIILNSKWEIIKDFINTKAKWSSERVLKFIKDYNDK